MGVFQTVTLIAATIAMGLIAGLFYTFSCAVMPGLARTDDRTYVVAMQRINEAILNGWFALSFGGALVLTGLAAVLHLGDDQRSVLPWIVAGLVLYVVVLVVTFRANIPLNNALAAAGEPDYAAVRERFATEWVRWNLVRTLVNTAAFAALACALLRA